MVFNFVFIFEPKLSRSRAIFALLRLTPLGGLIVRVYIIITSKNLRQLYNFFLTYQMAPYKSIKIRFEEFSCTIRYFSNSLKACV